MNTPLRPLAARLRRQALLVLACFLFMQVAAQLGAWVFPPLPAGVCSVAAGPDDVQWLGASSHGGNALAGHGLSCPLCSGPATPPPPELASRVPAPPPSGRLTRPA
ncbi:MAG: hypothetical protein RLZZ584_138 [Pseudomonadota bacterium]|jgi:hypothetical protein